MVLGSANIAEGLRGYMTKYDCSSADLNPIGGINKSDIKSFLNYFGKEYNLPVLNKVAGAQPTAELRPHDGKAETT
jgi:NAD+ synthase (glutamine-hydrolysing)